MENASKALLIAGAILIAILLIAIGMMVFNSASGVIDSASAGMTDYEKTAHNKKFRAYEGVCSGSEAKKICSEIHVNNSNENNPKVRIEVKIGDDVKGATPESDDYLTNYYSRLNQLKLEKSYKVECADKSGNGENNTVDDGIISKVRFTEI